MKDYSGPAFPIPGLQDHEAFNGMTLRDYFAAKAMAATITAQGSELSYSEIARAAYGHADAMLAERA